MTELMTIMPDPDPIPLPAPVFLLKALLVLTFILHLFPMNLLLGGGFIAPLTEWLGRRRQSLYHLKLARSLATTLPIATAFAITLGVAPLLFIQVLYGQFFYTSSILMAWPWLSVVLLMILGYFGVYVYALRRERLGPKAVGIGFVSALLFTLVSFLYTNNLVLMLTPEGWAKLYAESQAGFRLNLGDPTVIPRSLHFLLAAFAVTGLFIVLVGLLNGKAETAYRSWAVKYGVIWFAVPTLLQFLVGPWFLFSLPAPVRDRFLGGNTLDTTLLLAGILLALVGLALLFLALAARDPRPPALAGIGCVALTIVFMAIVRHRVREAYLAPHFSVEQLPAEPQTAVILLFFAIFIGGLAVVGFMLWKLLTTKITPLPTTPPS